MTKFLVTSGCSFSECISPWVTSWPKHLAAALPEYTHFSCALGSQGNGLISRKLIHRVSKLLKDRVNPQDILVGVMWSGPDRHDYYIDETPMFDFTEQWMENPTGFTNDNKNWVILNYGWRNKESGMYYKNFHSITGSMIYTLEHILRTQWFLELHNIPYFMTTYTSKVFTSDVATNPETDFLYNQINFNRFLPVLGEYEWIKENSKFEFPVSGDFHPGNNQHKEFTDQIILPFLKEN